MQASRIAKASIPPRLTSCRATSRAPKPKTMRTHIVSMAYMAEPYSELSRASALLARSQDTPCRCSRAACSAWRLNACTTAWLARLSSMMLASDPLAARSWAVARLSRPEKPLAAGQKTVAPPRVMSVSCH